MKRFLPLSDSPKSGGFDHPVGTSVALKSVRSWRAGGCSYRRVRPALPAAELLLVPPRALKQQSRQGPARGEPLSGAVDVKDPELTVNPCPRSVPTRCCQQRAGSGIVKRVMREGKKYLITRFGGGKCQMQRLAPFRALSSSEN